MTRVPAQAVYELAFSPKGSFLITWERPGKDPEGNATKNLKVWMVVDSKTLPSSEGEDQSPIGSFVQRSQTGWNLQYTSDEQYCARAVTNEVQFYESADLRTVWNKLRVEGVSDFALSGGQKQSIAVFIPERKVPHIPDFAKPRPDCTDADFSICDERANPRQSRFLEYRSSLPRSRKRPFSRETRSNSSGTISARA